MFNQIIILIEPVSWLNDLFCPDLVVGGVNEIGRRLICIAIISKGGLLGTFHKDRSSGSSVSSLMDNGCERNGGG
jgi:hypothetical protein